MYESLDLSTYLDMKRWAEHSSKRVALKAGAETSLAWNVPGEAGPFHVRRIETDKTGTRGHGWQACGSAPMQGTQRLFPLIFKTGTLFQATSRKESPGQCNWRYDLPPDSPTSTSLCWSQ